MLATQMRNLQKKPGNMAHSNALTYYKTTSRKLLAYYSWYICMLYNEVFRLKSLVSAIVNSYYALLAI